MDDGRGPKLRVRGKGPGRRTWGPCLCPPPAALAACRVFRHPFERTQELARRLDEWESRSRRALDHLVRLAQQRTPSLAARLEALSPLTVLRRGYSITERAADGQLVHSTGPLALGDQIRTRLAAGQLLSRVEQLTEDHHSGDQSAGRTVQAIVGTMELPLERTS